MSGMGRRAAAAVCLQLAAAAILCGTVLGVDDYTLPFYDPTVAMSYGVAP